MASFQFSQPVFVHTDNPPDRYGAQRAVLSGSVGFGQVPGLEIDFGLALGPVSRTVRIASDFLGDRRHGGHEHIVSMRVDGRFQCTLLDSTGMSGTVPFVLQGDHDSESVTLNVTFVPGRPGETSRGRVVIETDIQGRRCVGQLLLIGTKVGMERQAMRHLMPATKPKARERRSR